MLSGVERAPTALSELRRAGCRSQRLPVVGFRRISRWTVHARVSGRLGRAGHGPVAGWDRPGQGGARRHGVRSAPINGCGLRLRAFFSALPKRLKSLWTSRPV